MKCKIKQIYLWLLLIISSVSCFNQVFAQEKINISAGIGLPELLNIGVRYQLDQAQIGLKVGSLPGNNDKLFSLSGDIYYHFGGLSDLSIRRPWYSKIGLNFFRDETEYTIFKYLYLDCRIGKDINLSKKMGINLDAGLGVQLILDKVKKKESYSWFNLDLSFPVIPTLGLCLFYRI